MKTNKLLAAFSMLAVLASAVTGCEGKKDVAVQKISLSKSSLDIKTGEEAALTVTFTPENATNTNVTWNTGNPSVASVTDGVVKGLSEGTSTITVVSEDGNFSASCLVSVTDYHAESVEITPAEIQNLKKGESVQFTATVLPSNSINKNVLWTSSNTAVATVDETGKVTAVGGGEADITVSTVDGNRTATVKVYVSVTCEGIALSESSIELYETTAKSGIVLTFTPEDCSNKEVEWNYDNTIVSLGFESDGTITVTAILEGETTVKATSKDGGFTAEFKVKVLAKGTVIPDDNYGKYE